LYCFPTGLIIFAFGFGYPVLIRSIVTAHAAANDIPVSLLYSGLAYAETLGSFIGATVLTAAFTSTISKGGAIAGIPFFICTVRISQYSCLVLQCPSLREKKKKTCRSSMMQWKKPTQSLKSHKCWPDSRPTSSLKLSQPLTQRTVKLMNTNAKADCRVISRFSTPLPAS
jgi:hypothetical protein